MTVLLPDGDSLIPTFENDPDYIELDRAPTGQRVFERRTGGRMKQITVTLRETIAPDDDREYLAVFSGGVMSTDSEQYEETARSTLLGYICADDIVAAVEAALKGGE